MRAEMLVIVVLVVNGAGEGQGKEKGKKAYKELERTPRAIRRGPRTYDVMFDISRVKLQTRRKVLKGSLSNSSPFKLQSPLFGALNWTDCE